MSSLFISCVSDEFANYRDALRKDFTRPNLEAKIQENFVAYGSATLEKLDDYIQHCEAVIHFCGDMTGSMANEASLQYINNKYKDFATRLPILKQILEGNAEASYAQWETYLAAYHNKRIFVVAPTATAIRNTTYLKDDKQAAHQQAHLSRLEALGYYAEIHFNNEDELAKKLYQSKLGEIVFGTPKRKPVNLRYPSIGAQFKGREDFIKDVHKTLNETNSMAAIAIHALGGMGKTRLAVEYAWQYKNDYTALLFVNASSPELLKTNIANLSEPKILDLPEHAAPEEHTRYTAVINWLNQYTGWLLIADNADTKEAVKNLRDFLSKLQHGHIIITSRIDNWASPVKHKRLEVLDEDSAVGFLMESTRGQRQEDANDAATALLIVNDLGRLALALDQARAYINTNEISFENYRKAWEANRSNVLSWYDELQTEYPASVAITWQTSFNQLSAEAITLLNRLSWLSPDPIPKTLLEVEVPGAEKIDAQIPWQELKQYSLATSSADKKTFTIHKLVQDIARSKLDKTMKYQILINALNWLNSAFSVDINNVHIDNWPNLAPLIPHILNLLIEAPTNESSNRNRLMYNLGLAYFIEAEYTRTVPNLQIAVTLINEALVQTIQTLQFD